MKRAAAAATVSLLVLAPMAEAQHQHGASRDSMPGMTMLGPLGISMDRLGSGTTWIPDAVTLPSRHFMAGKWTLMVNGFLFGQ